MSTPSTKEDRFQQLAEDLRVRLTDVDFESFRVGPMKQRSDGAAITIELGAVEIDREPRPVTTTFEEDLEHVPNKNRELMRRLARHDSSR